jgi:hypothetical protein
MARQAPGLRAPTPGDVSHVPRVDRDGPWQRCVDNHHPQPWYFSSRDTATDPGRFDLATPNGTCYLAATPAAAIIERVADPDTDDPAPVTAAALAALRVWSGRLDDGHGMADTTVASVPRLTAEVATVVPYDLPHAWADALAADGAAGLLYRARFASDQAVALFGRAGFPDPNAPGDLRDRGRLRSRPATDHLASLPPAFRGDAVASLDAFDTGRPPR